MAGGAYCSNHVVTHMAIYSRRLLKSRRFWRSFTPPWVEALLAGRVRPQSWNSRYEETLTWIGGSRGEKLFWIFEKKVNSEASGLFASTRTSACLVPGGRGLLRKWLKRWTSFGHDSPKTSSRRCPTRFSQKAGTHGINRLLLGSTAQTISLFDMGFSTKGSPLSNYPQEREASSCCCCIWRWTSETHD